MKLSIILPLLISIGACHSARKLPINTTSAILPMNNGYVVFQQTDTLTGVIMPEINRVAQAWIKAHSQDYAFEWQPPVYKAELMYTGKIRPEQVHTSGSEYYDRRQVNYLLTVSAKDGLCRLLLTNFDVAGVDRGPVALEKLVGDQALCRSVDREAAALLRPMSAYIRRNVNKATQR